MSALGDMISDPSEGNATLTLFDVHMMKLLPLSLQPLVAIAVTHVKGVMGVWGWGANASRGARGGASSRAPK